MRLILASTSPRRREIMALLGLPFDVIAPDFHELVSDHRPLADEVLDFAKGKAATVARKHPESMVVGSDTMILLDGKKIGKPEGIDNARAILRALSDKTHCIFTSVAIIDGTGGPGLATVQEVSVRMRAYSHADVERYLARGESLDKAGAYSIQGEGRALIEWIRGDYLAAVGLPLKCIAEYLKSRGVRFPLDVNRFYAKKAFLNWSTF
ncbi:MAG: Maf family protein [Alphaproteobacteria bacterium]